MTVIRQKPAPLDLEFHQGDDFELLFTCYGSDGQPLDLYGFGFKAQMRAEQDRDAQLLVECDCTLVGEPGDGVVSILFPAEDTAGINTEGWWDWEVTHPDGRVRTYLAGKCTVTKEVTV